MNPLAKTCYVSIPFGIKPDPQTGRPVDFDRVLGELIRPAIEQAGLECLHAADFTGTLIHKEIARAVIAADVLLADVSGGNPNVLYELGIRHALRRGATLLLSHTRLPSNIAQIWALTYRIDGDGRPDAASLAAARDELARALADKASGTSNDSPLYEYFPELRAELPPDLRPPETRRRPYPPQAQPRGADRKGKVAEAERAVQGTQGADPQAYLDVLRRWAGIGDWREVIRAAREMPAEVAALPQVVQTVALAWSRLGDLPSAISLLEGHLARSSGDPETRALLGSIFKKQYAASGSTSDLVAALEQYRLAFAASRQDLYLGRNLAQLLHRHGTPEALAELDALLPELRELAAARTQDSLADFWTLDSALLLTLLSGDEAEAASHLDAMLTLRADAWMLAAVRTELGGVLEHARDDAERARIGAAIARLDGPETADAEEADDAQL